MDAPINEDFAKGTLMLSLNNVTLSFITLKVI